MKTRSGIFWRDQGGHRRAYARLNGVRIALCLPGTKRGVTDEATAQALYGQLVAAHQKQQLRHLHDVPEPMTLAEAARDFLIAKAEEAAVTTAWLEGEELRLQRAVEHLGGDCDLATIRVADLKRYAAALRRRRLSGGTLRQHLNKISAALPGRLFSPLGGESAGTAYAARRSAEYPKPERLNGIKLSTKTMRDEN